MSEKEDVPLRHTLFFFALSRFIELKIVFLPREIDNIN